MFLHCSTSSTYHAHNCSPTVLIITIKSFDIHKTNRFVRETEIMTPAGTRTVQSVHLHSAPSAWGGKEATLFVCAREFWRTKYKLGGLSWAALTWVAHYHPVITFLWAARTKLAQGGIRFRFGTGNDYISLRFGWEINNCEVHDMCQF